MFCFYFFDTRIVAFSSHESGLVSTLNEAQPASGVVLARLEHVGLCGLEEDQQRGHQQGKGVIEEIITVQIMPTAASCSNHSSAATTISTTVASFIYLLLSLPSRLLLFRPDPPSCSSLLRPLSSSTSTPASHHWYPDLDYAKSVGSKYLLLTDKQKKEVDEMGM